MIKVFLAGVIIAMSLICSVFADEAKNDVPKVYITGSKQLAGDLYVHSKEVPNGIYVVTRNSGKGIVTDVPAVNELIKGLIAKRGLKVVDKMEGASMALIFIFGFDMDLSAAEEQLSKQATESALTGKKIANTATGSAYSSALIQGTVTGNAAMGAMGAAGLIGSIDTSGKVVMITGIAQPNPKVAKGFFGGEVIDQEKPRQSNAYAVYFRSEKKRGDITPAMRELLVISVNKWIDAFMVNDDAPPVAVIDRANMAASAHPEYTEQEYADYATKGEAPPGVEVVKGWWTDPAGKHHHIRLNQ